MQIAMPHALTATLATQRNRRASLVVGALTLVAVIVAILLTVATTSDAWLVATASGYAPAAVPAAFDLDAAIAAAADGGGAASSVVTQDAAMTLTVGKMGLTRACQLAFTAPVTLAIESATADGTFQVHTTTPGAWVQSAWECRRYDAETCTVDWFLAHAAASAAGASDADKQRSAAAAARRCRLRRSAHRLMAAAAVFAWLVAAVGLPLLLVHFLPAFQRRAAAWPAWAKTPHPTAAATLVVGLVALLAAVAALATVRQIPAAAAAANDPLAAAAGYALLLHDTPVAALLSPPDQPLQSAARTGPSGPLLVIVGLSLYGVMLLASGAAVAVFRALRAKDAAAATATDVSTPNELDAPKAAAGHTWAAL